MSDDTLIRIDVFSGAVKLKPIVYTDTIESRGLFSWWWVRESEYCKMEMGPYWTSRQACLAAGKILEAVQP